MGGGAQPALCILRLKTTGKGCDGRACSTGASVVRVWKSQHSLSWRVVTWLESSTERQPHTARAVGEMVGEAAEGCHVPRR